MQRFTEGDPFRIGIPDLEDPDHGLFLPTTTFRSIGLELLLLGRDALFAALDDETSRKILVQTS